MYFLILRRILRQSTKPSGKRKRNRCGVDFAKLYPCLCMICFATTESMLCCYHYICGHPGSFARPPCHNKVYLNWQPPKLTRDDDSRYLQQRDIMIELTRQVRQAVIEKVLNAQRSMRWHPDSSTGITPSAILGIELRMPGS